MAAAIDPRFPGVGFPLAPIIIKENSIPRKAMACIPVVGMIFSFFQERSLANQINRTPGTEVFTIIELINVKNQYKVANLVSSLLTIVLTVIGVATGFFSALAIIIVMLCIEFVLLDIYFIHHNKQIVYKLETTGRAPGMLVE